MEQSVLAEKESIRYCLTCAEAYVVGPESLIHSYHMHNTYTKYREELAEMYKSMEEMVDPVRTEVSNVLKNIRDLISDYTKTSGANAPKEKPLNAMIAAFVPALDIVAFLKSGFQQSVEGTSSLAVDEIMMMIADIRRQAWVDPKPSTFVKSTGCKVLSKLHNPPADESTRLLSEIRLTKVRKEEALHKFSIAVRTQVLLYISILRNIALDINTALGPLGRVGILKAVPFVLQKFEEYRKPDKSLPTGLLKQLKELIRGAEKVSLEYRCNIIALAGRMAKIGWTQEPVISTSLGHVYFAGTEQVAGLIMPYETWIVEAVPVVIAAAGEPIRRTVQIYCLVCHEHRMRHKSKCDTVWRTYYFQRIQFDPFLCQTVGGLAGHVGAEHIYRLAPVANRLIYGVGRVCAKYSIAKNSWSPIPQTPAVIDAYQPSASLHLRALADRWIYCAEREGTVFRLDSLDEEAGWTKMATLKVNRMAGYISPCTVPLAPTQLLFFFFKSIHVLDTIAMKEQTVTFAHRKPEKAKGELVNPAQQPGDDYVECNELYHGHIYGYNPREGVLGYMSLRSKTFSFRISTKLEGQSDSFY